DGNDFLFEAVVMGVHHVEGHLHAIEAEVVLVRRLEHLQVNLGAFVAGESDVTHLAGFFSRENGFERAAGREDALGILHADDFMELEQVEMVGLQPAQGYVELLRGRLLVAAVNLGHQEGFLAVAIAEGFAHANFALAAVVVPTVVEEIDSAIEGGADDADTLLLFGLPADVPTAQADGGDLLAGAAEGTTRYFASGFGGPCGAGRAGYANGAGDGRSERAPEKFTARYAVGAALG